MLPIYQNPLLTIRFYSFDLLLNPQTSTAILTEAKMVSMLSLISSSTFTFI